MVVLGMMVLVLVLVLDVLLQVLLLLSNAKTNAANSTCLLPLHAVQDSASSSGSTVLKWVTLILRVAI